MENKTNKTQAQVNENVYVKDVNDKEFKTSDGFFRDPFTGVPLTGNEPRLNTGTRTPRIADSKGNPIPIAYKFWTKEEREAFNAGKGSGTRSASKSGTKNNELRDKLLGLQKYLADNKKLDDKIEAMIAAILPPDPEQEKLAKKVAGMSEEQKAMLKALLG